MGLLHEERSHIHDDPWAKQKHKIVQAKLQLYGMLMPNDGVLL